MRSEKLYYIYFLTNTTHSVVYTGVTNNLTRRVEEHKHSKSISFTHRYKVHLLVYYEVCNDIYIALNREKQIKAGSRKKKIDLIEGFNPSWRDLSNDL